MSRGDVIYRAHNAYTVIYVSESTTVLVSKETRDALKALGRKGESYDAIIRRLMEAVEE